jgi:hypothetical protein
MATERVVTRKWNLPLSQFLKSTVTYVDLEGAVRACKTTGLVWKIINYAQEHPGIKMLLTRWTQDGLDMQLRPKFYEECPPELLGKWNSKEEYQEFTNGSILYIRSLKTSDDSSRFIKFSGLTLAVIGLDQAEEAPEDVVRALKARLSQVGFPHQFLMTPNPPDPKHWLCSEFPSDGDLPNHLYLHTSVYDNRENLGDEYIAELEREYPPGTVLHRRFVLGLRGLSELGQPVYGAVFKREMHVREVEFDPRFPLLESWDFGQKHPATVWSQFLPGGLWNILGMYMGTRQFIDEAVPAVSALRRTLFPDLTTIRVCCDPAGADKQGHGIRQTAVDVLNSHLRQQYGPSVGASFTTGSNAPSKREFCIQQISGYLSRLIKGRPALLVHPRCDILIDGFEGGYVYDDRSFLAGNLPNIRRVKKDGYYDHSANCVEYTLLNYGASGLQTSQTPNLSPRERMRAEQIDYDEYDQYRRPQQPLSRAGY